MLKIHLSNVLLMTDYLLKGKLISLLHIIGYTIRLFVICNRRYIVELALVFTLKTERSTCLTGLFDNARRIFEAKVQGRVSDATIRGYLRAGSQIENIWIQIDARIDELVSKGVPPWEAYPQLRYALAFVRAGRLYVVFVRELLKAEEVAHPADADYLSRVVFDQADALCKQIEPSLNNALAALNDPMYIPNIAVPFALGPRIEYDPCPLSHLQGLINSAREMQRWAAGLFAKYENTMTAASNVPTFVTEDMNTLRGMLAQADFQLNFGTDLVGQVTPHDTTFELRKQAEDALWNAMQGYFFINQVVADPALLQSKQPLPNVPTLTTPGMAATTPGMASSPQQYLDRRVSVDDLWNLLASISARSDYYQQQALGVNPYRDSAPSEIVDLALEMEELHNKLHGVLPATAFQFLDEIKAAAARGDVEVITSWAECPYDPIYRANTDLVLVGERVPRGYEFHYNVHEHNYHGGIQMAPRFSRSSFREEEIEDDR